MSSAPSTAILPYDRFLIEQIAADRLPPEHGKRPLAALGFLTLGARFMGNVHDVIDDRIDVVLPRSHEPDGHLRPLPRPQVRSDPGPGLLLALRRAGQRPRAGDSARSRPSHQRTAAYAEFVKELEARQQKLSDFVAAKHRELVESTKRRVAEYLLAAQQALDQPTTEDFMLLADGSDLNPAMLVRWQAYLTRTRKEHDPVFAPWHALAALPERSSRPGQSP